MLDQTGNTDIRYIVDLEYQVAIITRRYYALAHNTPQVYILVNIFVHFQDIIKKRKILETLFVKEHSTLLTSPRGKYLRFGSRNSSPRRKIKK